MHITHIALEKGILYTYVFVCTYEIIRQQVQTSFSSEALLQGHQRSRPSSGLKPFFRAISGVNLPHMFETLLQGTIGVQVKYL